MIEKIIFEIGPVLGKITPASRRQKLQTWPHGAIVNTEIRS